MTTEFSMLGIMNAALLAQGQEEVLSDNDGSIEWRLLFRNWPAIVEAELEDGFYNFTREQAELLSRTDGKFGMTDGYLVPHDALHVRRVWITNEDGERIQTDWLQDGSYVYLCNPDGCFIEYLMVPDTSLWSANFTRGVQKKLEALLAMAVKEEASEARALEQDAEAYFQRARTKSSKQKSPQPLYRKGGISRARRQSWQE